MNEDNLLIGIEVHCQTILCCCQLILILLLLCLIKVKVLKMESKVIDFRADCFFKINQL